MDGCCHHSCICLFKCNSDWRSCCKYVHHWHCLTCDTQHQQQDGVLSAPQSHYVQLQSIIYKYVGPQYCIGSQPPHRPAGRARQIRCDSFLSVICDMKILVIDIVCQPPSSSLSGVVSHFLKSGLLCYDSSQHAAGTVTSSTKLEIPSCRIIIGILMFYFV